MSTLDELFAELDARAEGVQSVNIVLGTVGWLDTEDVFDLGDETNDGYTLIRVQLLGGRDLTQPLDPNGRGQGAKLLCMMADHVAVNGPPQKGDRCLVLLPHGQEQTNGCGIVTAIVSKQDTRRARLTKGEAVLSPKSGAARVVVRTDGTISLLTSDDNTATGNAVVFTVSSTKLAFTAPWGSFVFDATGFHLKTAAGPRIDMGGMNIPGIPSAISGPLTGYFTVTSPMVTLKAGSVYAGLGPMYQPAVAAPVLPLPIPPPPAQIPLPGGLQFGMGLWVSTL